MLDFLCGKNNMTRDSKDWQKLLFKSDRSLQIAELIELQDLLKNQQSKSFNHLLNRFYISKPIVYRIREIQNNSCFIEILSGQVYVTLNREGFFIDLLPEVITVSLSSEKTIKLIPFLETIEDQDEFRDPLTGGEICGDLGANRQVIKYSFSLGEDGYPLLQVIPTISGYPKVLSTSNLFSKSLNSLSSSLIEEYLAQRLYEEAGNFIVEGFETVYTSSSIIINPGVAYIEGYKVEVLTPQIIDISEVNSNSSTSFIYLSRDSKLSVSSQSYSSSSFLLLSRVENTDDILEIYNSEDRNILISELQVLQNQNNQNEEDLSQINLQLNTLSLTTDSNSSSIFVDSFNSLKNSNTFHPLYSALINPSSKLLRPPIKSLDLNFDSAEVRQLLNIKISENKNYCFLSYSTKTFLSQRRASGFINLKPSSISNPILRISPQNSNYISNKYLTTVKPLNILREKSSINLEVTKYLKSQEISIEGYGFSANANNLKVYFDNKQINQLINSKSGSESFSISADAEGKISFKFLVPSDLEFKSYIIEVSNNLERALISWQPLTSEINQLSIFPSNGEIGQSFKVLDPISLVGINLAFRKISSSKVETLFNFSINPLILGRPSSEALYSGVFNNSNVATSSNGSSLTYIPLEFPLNLSTGEYVLVINSLSEETDVYLSDINTPSLIANIESTPQQISNLKLFVKENSKWEEFSNKSLTFELIQAIPSSNLGEIEFDLINPLETIDQAEITLKQFIPQACSSTLFYKSKSQSWIEFKPNLSLDQLSNTLSLKLQLRSSSNQVPVIDLKNSQFNLQSNQLTGTWVSKNISTFAYQNVKSTFDYYLPTGTSIKVFFSSNLGETWESLEIQGSLNNEDDLVDGNIPLYKATFIKSNLSKTVSVKEINQKTSEILRTNLMVRVDFQTNYRWLVPFIQNFSTITY